MLGNVEDDGIQLCRREQATGALLARVGTLDAYYDANMDLCSVSPTFNLYDITWPIRTRVRQYPPAKFVPVNRAALEQQ